MANLMQAERAGLGVSMFERLQSSGIPPTMLTLQYRMHPTIAAFPSAAFYDSKLGSAVTAEDRKAPSGLSNAIHVQELG